MFDREVIRDFKVALRPFLPLFIVIAVAVGVGLGLLSYALFSNQKTSEQSYATSTEVMQGAATQQIAEQAIEPAPAQQPAAQPAATQTPTPKPKPTSQPTPAPVVVPAPATAPAPQFSVSFSGGGCTATIKAQPGAKVIIGAFNDSKGGESRYFMPASGILIQRTSGIWGMTSFAQILAADGTSVFYKTSTITVETCPLAGVSEW